MELLNKCSEEELQYRENFKRDYKFSCPVIDDTDIFKKSLIIADLVNEWNDYYEMCKTIPKFDDYRREMRNTIIQLIISVKGYANMSVTNLKLYDKYKGPKSYLRDELIGKRLVSVDLVKGNYQAMKYLNSAYVDNTNTYEELIGKYTKYEPMIRSKFFRQMIFGQLNPQIQGMVQQEMIGNIIEQIYKKIGFFEICFLSNDEVIFVINSDLEKQQIKDVVNTLSYEIRVTEFKIEKIANSYEEQWYVKHYIDTNKSRLMGVHTRYLMQVYNHVMGIENTTKDFWWRECGRLCMIMEPEKFLLQYNT